MKKFYFLFFLFVCMYGLSFAEDYCRSYELIENQCKENPLQRCSDLKKLCEKQKRQEYLDSQSKTSYNRYLTPKELCYQEFGKYAIPGSDSNTCICKDGYIWSSDMTYCTKDKITNDKQSYKTKIEDGLKQSEIYIDSYYDVLGKKEYQKAQEYLNKENSLLNSLLLYCNMFEEFNTLKEPILDMIKTVDEEIKKVNKLINGLSVNNNLEEDRELQNAISWMYDNGLTNYDSTNEFGGELYITREQASKFFVEFSKKTLGINIDDTIKVNIKDIKYADKSLINYIRQSNQLGLFKGSNGNFFPFSNLTKAQAIAVIIRMIDGVKDEQGNKRYNRYYNIANNLQLLTGMSFKYDYLDSINIKRGELAILLYRSNKAYLYLSQSKKACKEDYGDFSYGNGTFNISGNYNCYCKDGYEFDNLTNKCVSLDYLCKKNLGENSFAKVNYNNTYDCYCNTGYIYDDKNTVCKKIDGNDMCRIEYGENSYSDGKMDIHGEYSCFCKTGYDRNTNQTKCLSPTDMCQLDFGKYSYGDGTIDKEGFYNCFCKTGYDRNVGQTKCIKK